jgi:SAM-dependent methyltransferase
MNEVFGSTYADAYDLLYREKDYTAECGLIKRLLESYGDGAVCSILDLGCGTGNHIFPLAREGYELAGVDRSLEMLARAQKKSAASRSNGRVTFSQGDIRDVDLQCRFDAAIMMFAVLGYQLTNADVLSGLKTARRHLRPGGVFIFDVWYGPAVLHQRPSERVKVIPTPKGRILRITSGELDIKKHLCRVSYHLWRLEEGQMLEETKEAHSVRYFFPLELNLFLECAGFSPVRLGAFPEVDRDPDETTWNVLGVARAV